jgi:lysophospholipase L1-like esterase
MVAYVPFCGVVSRRYVPSLVELGMDRTTAEALAVDLIYHRQNRVVTEVCISLGLPLADATADLVQAEAAGVPQYWRYDTHPRSAGYATIARRIHRGLRGEAQ